MIYDVTMEVVIAGRIEATDPVAALDILRDALWSINGIENLVSEIDIDVRDERVELYQP